MNAESSPVLVVQRVDTAETPDVSEIQALARAAGYRVVDAVELTATFDPEYVLPPERLGDLAARVAAIEATTVVIDDKLTPHQTYNLAQRLPRETELIGRHRLLLAVLSERADTKEAQLQVERAQLAYERRRLNARGELARRDEEAPAFMGLDTYDPNREDNLEDRISRLRDELAAITRDKRRRIEQRRDDGYDLVALAGYANAGKSTLLQRLAADLAVDEDDEQHPDIESPVEVDETPFTTVGTTTRTLDVEDRDILLTDTMGIVSDLPDWLHDAFQPMFEPLVHADLVVAVVDASESLAPLHAQAATCQRVLTKREESATITALTKIDQVEPATIDDKTDALEDDLDTVVVPVSVHDEINIDDLTDLIRDTLPERERCQLQLPLTDDAMSLVSQIHDDAHVHETIYDAETVTIDFEARSDTVAKVQAKADTLR